MEVFNIIVGLATIASCIISVISLCKINDVQKNIRKTQQSIKDNKIDNGSQVVQIGGDNGRK